MEESECEEQEEYTEIYRRTKRRQRRTKNTSSDIESKGKTKQVLNPYIVGPKPRKTYNDEAEKEKKFGNRTKYTNDIVRETLQDLEKTHRNRKLSVFKPKENRIFWGECEDEDDVVFGKRNGLWKFQKTGKRGLDRFRRVAEFCTIATKIFNGRNAKLSQEDSILFFLNTHSHGSQKEEIANAKPLFDITPFKSLGQKSFINSVKKVLEIPPSDRTEQDVNSMCHQLQRFSTFSSYPKNVQRGLCKQGWYSRFESARIIAREGNNAEIYYFILSGIAVSRALNENNVSEDRRRVAEFLRQGDTIGEKEILTQAERPTTIVCKEPVDVLGVDKEDLLNIFKISGGSECIEFLRLIPELEDFPLQLLQTHHFSCSMHYYKRGSVIVKNSNDAEWIYVVKSGSCQVYKALKKRMDKQNAITKLKRELSEQFFPELSRKDSAYTRSSSVDDNTKRSNVKTRARHQSSEKTVHLPQINSARNSMVSIGTESRQSSPRIQTPNKRLKKKPDSRRDSDGDRQTDFYVKLDIITERECFGLQSLIYEDTPSLSLVSNGAECILISKQFLMNHLDKDIRKRLLNKIPPFPNLSQIRDVIGDQLIWDLYKEKVVNETLN